MGKFLSVISIAWGICKRFDGEEVKEIVAKIKALVVKFDQLNDDGWNVEEGLVIVKEAVDVYKVIKDAYDD